MKGTALSIAVPRSGSSSSRYRVYLDLALLLTLASWEALGSATLAFLGLCGVPYGHRAMSALSSGQAVVAFVAFAWLNLLVIDRTHHQRHSRRRRLAARAAATVLGAAGFAVSLPAVQDHSRGVGVMVLYSFVLVWLTVEVCRHHGVSPRQFGLHPGRRERSGEPTKCVIERTMTAMALGTGVTFALVQIMLVSGTSLPVMRTPQITALGIDNAMWMLLPQTLWAVVIEDTVMVGATAALLTAAGARPRTIYLITCGIEVAIHAYFGLPAIGMALYAYGRSKVYQSAGRLTVLIAVHATWDLSSGFLQMIPLHRRLPIALGLGGGLWAITSIGHYLLRRRSHRQTLPTPPSGDARLTDILDAGNASLGSAGPR